jgi:hypothetical protein
MREVATEHRVALSAKWRGNEHDSDGEESEVVRFHPFRLEECRDGTI